MTTVVRAVGHKSMALAAAAVNVVVPAAVLSTADAGLYLAMFSLVQLSIPLAGLGMFQRLVSSDPAWAVRVRPWRAWAGSTTLGVVVLGLQATTSDAAAGPAILAMAVASLVLVGSAERIRAIHGRQVGFVAYNLVLAVSATVILLAGRVPGWLFLVPLGAWVVVEWTDGWRVLGSDVRVGLRGRDLLKAGRVTLVNQYYSVIIVGLSLLPVDPAVIVVLTVVYRFNIAFNWQTFLWLRLEHRATVAGRTDRASRQNRQMLGLNWLCYLVVVAGLVVAAAVGPPLVPPGLSDVLTFRLAGLVALFGGLAMAENLVFPAEVFELYRGTPRADLASLGTGALGLALVAVAVLAVGAPVVVIIAGELGWFGLRLQARWWAATHPRQRGARWDDTTASSASRRS